MALTISSMDSRYLGPSHGISVMSNSYVFFISTSEFQHLFDLTWNDDLVLLLDYGRILAIVLMRSSADAVR